MIKQKPPFPSLKELLKFNERGLTSLANMPDDDIRSMLYYQGDLTWKLDIVQKSVYDFFVKSKEKIVVAAISRQTGKSFGAIVMAFEQCLKNPNYVVRYATGDAVNGLKIIQTNVLDFIHECPEDVKPKYQQKINAWKFPNGSLLYLVGIDGKKSNKARGGAAHLIIIDEAAFISNLKYVVESIFMPMTTTTNGRILIISTPPSSKGHEFVRFVEHTRDRNSYIEIDIYTYLEKVKNEHPFFRDRILPEQIEMIRRDMLPETFAKEYLLKYETNLDDAVIPEFTKELKEKIIKDVKRPKIFHPYVAMDQAGVRDLIAIVFGYYDPIDDKIIVEAEIKLVAKEANNQTIAKGILEMEQHLWADEFGEINIPIKRYCDINESFMIRELSRAYKLKFQVIEKTDKKQAVDHLRTLLYNEVVIISPKCRDLAFHLENATWNTAGTSYVRSSAAGHYDFVDAMVYFVRAIKRKKLEFTEKQDYDQNRFQGAKKTTDSQATAALKKIFQVKIKRFGAKPDDGFK